MCLISSRDWPRLCAFAQFSSSSSSSSLLSSLIIFDLPQLLMNRVSSVSSAGFPLTALFQLIFSILISVCFSRSVPLVFSLTLLSYSESFVSPVQSCENESQTVRIWFRWYFCIWRHKSTVESFPMFLCLSHNSTTDVPLMMWWWVFCLCLFVCLFVGGVVLSYCSVIKPLW